MTKVRLKDECMNPTVSLQDANPPQGRLNIEILPLLPGVLLPLPAPSRTRDQVHWGHGTPEQCLPFVAAAGLGLLIPAPFSFGYCHPAEMPLGARRLAAPLGGAPAHDGRPARMFYVKDDPACAFIGNAYRIDLDGSPGPAWLEPGLSFFERQDQAGLFKVHLPYMWRTPLDVDLLVLPPVNRDGLLLSLCSAVVETSWQANPVNLVFRLPGASVHVLAGDAIAQAVLVPRHCRRPVLQVMRRDARESLRLAATAAELAPPPRFRGG